MNAETFEGAVRAPNQPKPPRLLDRKIRTRVLAATCFLAAAVTVALAESAIPRFDVQSYCRRVASISGTSLDGCVDIEQSAYDDLKHRWMYASQTIQVYCRHVARRSGGSYSMLKGCVELQEDAGQRNQQ